MGPFFPDPSISPFLPKHHSPKPRTHPFYPIPACTPLPLCRTEFKAPGREELSGSLSTVLLSPRDCRVQMLERVNENKTKLKQRDTFLQCARAVNISEWLSCILLASTLFLWAALRRRIACRREEIVVKAVLLP